MIVRRILPVGFLSVGLVAPSGCSFITTKEFDAREDFDGDGFVGTQFGGPDCDDNNAAVNPGATEVCDGVDNDCDGTVDNADAADASTWYADSDGDGYGGGSITGCAQPVGYVPTPGDCNDGDASINPSAEDFWYDGIDSNCDGADDYDQDGDGDESSDYGGGDCNDLDPTVNSSAVEVYYDGVDQNCDGLSDYDADGDGHDSVDWGGDDCDDTDATIHPGATDAWYDGVDSDCAGNDDYDKDGDGHDNTGSGGDDCNDGDVTIYAGAPEHCNGVDADCDGQTNDDESVDASTFYADTDGDHYGDPASPKNACSQPVGYVTDNTDCDDTDAAITYITWFQDSDGDNYGNALVSTTSCAKPVGYVADDTDCDDTTAGTNPGATEVCDAANVDEDCDGLADDDDPSATGKTVWHADADVDGFGSETVTVARCEQPSRYLADGTDCDDSASAVNPSAQEICDDVDNDCDGLIDDDDPSVTGQPTYFADADGDGYGTGAGVVTCDQGSLSTNASDCDDSDASVSPASGGCDISVATADATISGPAGFGWEADALGDENSDGLDEILVASQSAAYVFDSPLSGNVAYSDADASFSALTGLTTMSGLGDLDGDGFPDLIIGSPYSSPVQTYSGAAYIFFGPFSGRYSAAAAGAEIDGSQSDECLGVAVASGGDLNGDSTPDVVAYATWGTAFGSDTGDHVYTFAGPFSSATRDTDAFATITIADYGGSAGKVAGDWDGDGVDDLLVPLTSADPDGSGGHPGGVFVFSGPVSGSLGTADADIQIVGASSTEYLGFTVDNLGDTNADGYDDVSVGSAGYDDNKEADFVFEGPLTGCSSSADAAGVVALTAYAYAGHAAGDVDGDGRADFVVTGLDGGYLLVGPLEGTQTVARLTFSSSYSYDFEAWATFVGTGDTDGDGLDDLLLGDGYVGSTSTGAAYLFLGSSL